MFVVTAEGVIATDPVAYGRPTGGQTYLDEIRKVTDKPVKYVIYSHHHFDHIAGGKALKDAGATFVAHRRAKERLEKLSDPHTVLPDEAVPDTGRTITLGGTTLNPGVSASVQLSTDLAFDVQVANQGDSTETDVVVEVEVGEGDDAITLEGTLDTIAAGETKSVPVTLEEQPPTGQNVSITVTVQPVPGEGKTDNNSQTFSVIFTR